MVYFPPTFVYASIVGGIIMGLGFILGGYCPGTGACAVAIGKLDALFFVIGLYLGIFLFSEAFPLFEKLYLSKALGNVRVNEALGISSGLFAFLFIMAALEAFVLATWIQKRVKPVDYQEILSRPGLHPGERPAARSAGNARNAQIYLRRSAQAAESAYCRH